jgi:Zn-dependent M28 family amino/carboxypeptidase
LNDVFQVYNLSGKLMLVDSQDFSLALTFTAEYYNLDNIDSSNPNLNVASYLPGFTAGFELIPDVALFVGANLNYTQANVTQPGLASSGYVQGARGESDISWAYNHTKKHLGNVLSGGVSYDFTYKVAGFGVSHHWRGFQLGIHYYPNATDYRVQPIVVGGASFEI